MQSKILLKLGSQSRANALAKYFAIVRMVDRTDPGALVLDTSSRIIGDLLITSKVRVGNWRG